MPTMFVKPAPGRRVRYPDRPAVFLPEEGANVAVVPYWMRRLKTGDVVKAKPGAKSVAKAEKGA